MAIGIRWRNTHHGAPNRCCAFFPGRNRLNPQDIRAAIDQTARLFGKGSLALFERYWADRFKQFTRRADRARNHHRTPGLIRHSARDLGRGLRQFIGAILGIMQFQPETVSAKAVGQDDICTRIHEFLMHTGNPVRMVDIPKLWGIAGL